MQLFWKASRTAFKSCVVPAQSEHKIPCVTSAYVMPAVFFVRCNIGHRPRTQIGAAPGNSHFERTLPNQDHFFVSVVMGRMRPFAGSQFRLMQFDGEAD